ncbi:uncharacterized protein PV09_04026 [Verruconis gallopava]|uniref:Uncharacterized protein n=1 Tax=Verruconis gallopava TaxID=253628 RepID=A0A0D2B0E3_9PEZI|nr:uncharacterized protein PV09_04026 [Verruconis gallopava]KIW04844.1 hypothetical protein PV09_04026 [Verruconis gallopava]
MMAHYTMLLEIPREVRDQILFHVFFDATGAEAIEAVTINNRCRQVVTAYPKEHGCESLPKHLRSGHAPAQGFDVSVLRTCRQLQHEGEEVLYSNLKFDLWAYRYDYDARRKLLEKIGPANQARLRHLRISGLNLADVFDSHMPLCEWRYLTKFIATNCPLLQSLELQVSADEPFDAEHPWSTTTLSGPWIQALLQIKGIKELRFSVESKQRPDDVMFEVSSQSSSPDDDLCDHFRDTTAWLKKKMTEDRDEAASEESSSPAAPFDFTSLPQKIQKLIIRHAVLPEDKVIHTCLPLQITANSSNILSFLLSCRSVSLLTEEVIYQEALFSCCNSRFKHRFKEFLRRRSPRQRQLMRQFFCAELDPWADRSFFSFRRTKFPNLVDWNERGGFRWWSSHHPCFSVCQNALES